MTPQIKRKKRLRFENIGKLSFAFSAFYFTEMAYGILLHSLPTINFNLSRFMAYLLIGLTLSAYGNHTKLTKKYIITITKKEEKTHEIY